MKVLLIGSGGREHALAWSLAQTKRCEELYCAPGSAGIESCAECIDIKADDIHGLVAFAKDKQIDLVVVGPETPLVLGLADELVKAGIKVFGPSKAAAQLEGSKVFMKDLCKKYDIPTAAYGRFTDLESAREFIAVQDGALVVKADGLAAGKGVIICETKEEAEQAAADMLSGSSFGAAGNEIVIEEFLDGEELSYFAFADGKTVLPLTSAQDHKRAFDGDQGPNTGGMGAYSPAHLMSPELEQKIQERILFPLVKAMESEGCAYSGVVYPGIMVVKGEPYLLECNIRFGDPECQALIVRLKGDLLDILDAVAEGRLDSVRDEVSWMNDVSICVVMAAEGYPTGYKKGTLIRDLREADTVDNVMVFHADTAKEAGGYSNKGGRTLSITATGQNIGHAKRLVYEAIDKIDWPEGYCRRDIGWRAVQAEKTKVA